MIREWLEQPAKATVLGSLSIDQKPAKRPITLDRIYTYCVDELHPLKRAVERITNGTTIADEDNPFLVAWLSRGWTGKAVARLFGGQFDSDGNKIGDSLDAILGRAEVDGSLDDFRAYIVCLRANELHGRGLETGIEQEIVDKCLEELQAELGDKKLEEFEKLFQEVIKFQDNVLDQLVDTGMMTRASVKEMRENNQYYIPFYRLMEDSEGNFQFQGKKFANLSTPIKRLKGSTRTIIDPIESIVKNTYVITNVATRNNVGKKLVELAQRFPEDSGKWIEKIAAPMHGTTFTLDEIERVLQESGVDTNGIDLDNLATIFRPNYSAPRQDNILVIYRGGKREFYQVDKELYRALLFLDDQGAETLVKVMSYPTQLLRAGATLSPDFMAKNPVRDQFAAFVYAKYKYIPFVDLFKGLSHVIKRDDLYWEYYSSGAAHGNFVSVDRNYLQGDLRKILKNRTKQLDRDVVTDVGQFLKFLAGASKEIAGHPIEALRTISEATEEGTRIMMYKRARDAGESVFEAGLTARDTPQDFSRSGSDWIDFNIKLPGGKTMNRVNAFFNAGVGAIDKLAREFDPRNPKKAMRATYRSVLAITLPTILLFAINHDNEKYKERPQWEKDLFWLIPYNDGNSFIRIPKPFELGIIFGTMPERFMQWIVDKDPDAFKGFGDTVKQQIFLDLIPDKDMVFPSGLMPDAFLPVLELYGNKKEYTRTPIIPAYAEQPEGAKHLEYGPNTSTLAKGVGKLTGVSPYKVDHALFAYTGTLGRNVKDVGEAFLDYTGVIERPPKREGDLSAIPGLRSFAAAPLSASSAASIDRFYDDYEKAQSIEARKESGGVIKEEDKKLLRNLDAMGKLSRELSGYRRKQREITNSDRYTDKEKQDRIKHYDELMINRVRRFYGESRMEL